MRLRKLKSGFWYKYLHFSIFYKNDPLNWHVKYVNDFFFKKKSKFMNQVGGISINPINLYVLDRYYVLVVVLINRYTIQSKKHVLSSGKYKLLEIMWEYQFIVRYKSKKKMLESFISSTKFSWERN